MMKYFVICLFFTLLARIGTAYGQSKPKLFASASFEKLHIGSGFALESSISKNDHFLTIGLGLVLKSNPVDDQEVFMKNRAYPRTISEMFSLNIGYSFDLIHLGTKATLGPFWKMNLIRTTLREMVYRFETYGAYPPTGQILPIYSMQYVLSPKVLLSEQRIGLLMRYQLTPAFSIVEGLGFGIGMTNRRNLSSAPASGLLMEWIFPYIQIGLSYRFTNPNKE